MFSGLRLSLEVIAGKKAKRDRKKLTRDNQAVGRLGAQRTRFRNQVATVRPPQLRVANKKGWSFEPGTSIRNN